MKEIKITKIIESDFTKEMPGLDYVPWVINRKTGTKYINTGFKKRPGRKSIIVRLGGNENE